MAQLAENVIHMERSPYSGTYTVREAAMFLRATTPPPDVPVSLWRPRDQQFVATSRALYTWIRLGTQFNAPMKVSSRDEVISFEDLIRLRLIAVFRSRGFSYREIVEAEDYARKHLGVPQPFVTEPLWTMGDIFMEVAKHLLALTKRGQLAFPWFREFLVPASHGLRFDKWGIAERWLPSAGVEMEPGVQFGAPCIAGTRIETEAVWSFFQAGDEEPTIAKAFGISTDQVRAAIDWETNLSLAA